MDAEEKLRLDYEQTHQLIRMFTDIRFKLLAFVPTLTGAAVALLSNIENQFTSLALGLLGLSVTLGILFYEMRNTVLYDAAIHRAKCLELRLGFPLFDAAKTVGGVFNERPVRPALLYGTRLFPQPKQRIVTKVLVLKVSHDRALALVYGSAIGGWVYIMANSLLVLLSQQRSWADSLAATLIAGIVAFLSIRGLIRFDENRPKPQPTDQCSKGSEVP